LEFLLPLPPSRTRAARCARRRDCVRAIPAPRLRSAGTPAQCRAGNPPTCRQRLLLSASSRMPSRRAELFLIAHDGLEDVARPSSAVGEQSLSRSGQVVISFGETVSRSVDHQADVLLPALRISLSFQRRSLSMPEGASEECLPRRDPRKNRRRETELFGWAVFAEMLLDYFGPSTRICVSRPAGEQKTMFFSHLWFTKSEAAPRRKAPHGLTTEKTKKTRSAARDIKFSVII